MTRIPILRSESAPEGSRGLLDKLPKLNVFGALAHSPAALDGFVRMGNALLYKTTLDPVLRELVILRVAHLAGCDYERRHHEDAAAQLGAAPQKVRACEVGAEDPAFCELEAAALRFAEALSTRPKAPDALWDELANHLDEAEMVELTLTVGYYMMVARFLLNAGVEPEEEGTEGLSFG